MNKDAYRYYAFISYKREDEKWAKWLHKELESYKLPTTFHNEIDGSKFLRPIFRDKTDLGQGILNDVLKEELSKSKYLIVICSPRSANSKWVNKEIETFIKMGRYENIIPFIVEGIPYDDEKECLPYVLKDYFAEFPEKELLGININESGKTSAFIHLVARMLDLHFDDLWQRYRRTKRAKIAISSTLVLVAALTFYYFAIPISLNIRIGKIGSDNLPETEHCILTIGGKQFHFTKPDTLVRVELPGYKRLSTERIEFMSGYYNSVDTTLNITGGINQDVSINVSRDSTFAIYEGIIIDIDRIPIPNCVVSVGDQSSTTDIYGKFAFYFTVKDQTISKPIQVSHDGYNTFYREDETPSSNITIIITQK